MKLTLQSIGQKDYIVHLAKTPPPLGKNVVEETLISSTTNVQQETVESYIKSVRDIPESWVADHAKHVCSLTLTSCTENICLNILKNKKSLMKLID